MKDKIDYTVVRALLRKQRQERRYVFAKGNFDALGFLLRLALVGVFVAVFVIFFGQFMDIYLAQRTNNLLNPGVRLYELLAASYMVILLAMTVGGVSAIVRELFLADDVKIFSAMPVSAKTLFVAKLISIYRSQLILALIAVLTVNGTAALHYPVGAWFYVSTVAICLIFPLISIAIASILSLPYFLIRQFISPRFFLLFVVITAIAAVAVWLYSILLGAVEGMMSGDKNWAYFFDEEVMTAIGTAVSFFYPANWLASIVMQHNLLECILGIALLTIVCIVVSLLIIRGILTRILQSRISGDVHFMYPAQPLAEQGTTFGSLLKKEFVMIFRTPSYMFSYFSVALLMPLMTYFCMNVASNLVSTSVGLNFDFSLELAVFLTVLFSALTNVFCSTNISREGSMFYSIKALPISHTQFFLAKVIFCMLVALVSQSISAVVLAATGYVSPLAALFLFGVGVVFSFAQVCFATRYDFNHARFSTEDDGEIKEAGSTVSTIIVLGMAVSFLIGAATVIVKMVLTFQGGNPSGVPGYITYAIVGGIVSVVAVCAYIYLIYRLKKRYYEFSGGGLM